MLQASCTDLIVREPAAAQRWDGRTATGPAAALELVWQEGDTLRAGSPNQPGDVDEPAVSIQP
jgi:hypothetical protein